MCLNMCKTAIINCIRYVKARVGEVAVYYMGKLHIEDGETSEDYIYYTTDTQITNKTVYAVLKKHENEKITLTYSHRGRLPSTISVI